MGSFFGGIFSGSNPTLTSDINNAGGISGFGTSVGEGDISAASGFYSDLLSGNQAKISELLAPEIGNIQKQGNEQIQTAAEFGNRSGGTNASAQSNIDDQRAKVNDMVSKLTGGAASGLASIGTSMLGDAITANGQQAELSQEKLKNEQNSIFGQGIYGAEGIGLGAGGLATGMATAEGMGATPGQALSMFGGAS